MTAKNEVTCGGVLMALGWAAVTTVYVVGVYAVRGVCKVLGVRL